MLQQISIKNYALIDSLEIDFKGGLSIITGETGAGKSIILGALRLVMGERADLKLLSNKDTKCVIEVSFDIELLALQTFFEVNDLDYESQTTLRREITVQGKSRAFINDTPVTLVVLRELSEQLIDIHSQHDTLLLNDKDFQTHVTDVAVGNEQLFKAYTSSLKALRAEEKMLVTLEEQQRKSKTDESYFNFLLTELTEAAIVEGELPDNEQEVNLLSNAEDIKSALENAVSGLDNESNSVLSMLGDVRNALKDIAEFNPQIEAIYERIDSTFIELQDAQVELGQINDSVQYDPERLTFLNERINTLNSLLHKHGVATDKELLVVQEGLEKKVLQLDSIEEEIEQQRTVVAETKATCFTKATALSENRKKHSAKLITEVEKLLQDLGMKDAQFDVEVITSDELTAYGVDAVQFLFSANKGGNAQPLGKVASGGELSRLMLSLKSILSKSSDLPTIIFDEIDTGVSGEIADKMGAIMSRMAESMQVLAITHLPQVAVKGKTNFKVVKQEEGETTRTTIIKLSDTEKLNEIAQMLSGSELTAAALENAKQLMGVN